MYGGGGKLLGEALGWLLVTMLPVALAMGYNETASLLHNGDLPPDPRDWNWAGWVVQLGPLLGFGFLAGATLRVPDPVFERRGPRRWVRKRAFWVAVGPWLGLVIGAAVFLCLRLAAWLFEPTVTTDTAPVVVEHGSTASALPAWLRETLQYVASVAAVAFFGYLWLIPAVAAVRRAKRIGLGLGFVQGAGLWWRRRSSPRFRRLLGGDREPGAGFSSMRGSSPSCLPARPRGSWPAAAIPLTARSVGESYSTSCS